MRGCLQRHPRTEAIDAARARYRELVAAGTSSFFEPRRSACPLCAASSLLPHLTATDLVQRKPGRFTLERCAGCGLIFQNPALSPEGLAYYYRDFYDGLNADVMDDVFASTHPLYGARVDAVISGMDGGAAPARWLDVGCGYGHLSLAARWRLPSTRFEGLDRSASVDEALRRGWLDRAWRMTTTQLVETGERFDVVTLFHYLEHTQDPAAEIRRARQLLVPAGRLVVEVPNPRCRLGRILGRWWFPWFQPQHQVFLDADGVCRLLVAAGLRPSSVTYLMTAGDILLSALIATRRACSAGDVPWADPPGTVRRAADLAVWAAALPVLAAALIADAFYGLLPSSPATSNALRVVAVPIEP
jgi:SAM-dependent methyltransferase